VRTKASVHTLSGHTNAVATVRCQAAEPQIITGMIDIFQIYRLFISKYITIVRILSILTLTSALYCIYSVSLGIIF
jgi:hypothetical protein